MAITINVDVDIDLEDVDAVYLARALIKKNNWRTELDKALSGPDKKNAFTMGSEPEVDELRMLIDNYRQGKPLGQLIAAVAYQNYGLVC